MLLGIATEASVYGLCTVEIACGTNAGWLYIWTLLWLEGLYNFWATSRKENRKDSHPATAKINSSDLSVRKS
jgi:hypothetical protein